MICPKCNNKMIEGYLCPSAGIRWLPKNSKSNKKLHEDKKEGFFLTKQTLVTWTNPIAHYCDTCDVILIDCSIKY